MDRERSIGPHQLLRDGATIAIGLEDIVNGLGPLPMEAMEAGIASPSLERTDTDPGLFAPPQPTSVATIEITLTDRQQKILDVVGKDPTTVDAIIEQTELPAAEVMQDLTLLTLKSLVKRVDGQQFVRTKR